MKRIQIVIIVSLLIILFFFNLYNFLPDNLIPFAVVIAKAIDIICSVSVLLTSKRVEVKISWVLLILFIPVLGTILYLVLGVEYNKFIKFNRKKEIDEKINKELNFKYDGLRELKEVMQEKQDILTLAANLNEFPITMNNKSKILINGDAKFKALCEAIRSACDFIHLEYFIIHEGKIFNEIKEELIKAASRGVTVRILYDDYGSINFSAKTVQELTSNGISVASFSKVYFHIIRPSVNYRNHRKIVVIDNKIGFVGGINIGDEYAHLDPYYGHWRDTHLMLEGDSVKYLNVVFIKDWFFTTNEMLSDTKYLAEYPVINSNRQGVQILSDGPDNKVTVIKNIYFKLINEAKKEIWITTPYLIPDYDLLSALKVASLGGVDVRILIPGKSDKGKKLIYRASESYISELADAGVKIYKYNNSFMHSKVVVVDRVLASIGTVNIDFRSFDLNFEVTALLYNDLEISNIVTMLEKDFLASSLVDIKKWKKRGFKAKFIESVMKIITPIL